MSASRRVSNSVHFGSFGLRKARVRANGWRQKVDAALGLFVYAVLSDQHFLLFCLPLRDCREHREFRRRRPQRVACHRLTTNDWLAYILLLFQSIGSVVFI
jgi:hypothetical protein